MPKLIDYVSELCYNQSTALNNCMTNSTTPKKFTDALKDALAKKQAAAHPDAKTKTGKSGQTKRSGTPVIAGRPVQRAVGRGG